MLCDIDAGASQADDEWVIGYLIDVMVFNQFRKLGLSTSHFLMTYIDKPESYYAASIAQAIAFLKLSSYVPPPTHYPYAPY